MCEQAVSIEFCTLGMFIIDEIHPPPGAKDATPQLNVVGGAGTYSAIGARLFSPGSSAASVGWIVDEGTDFPPEIRQALLSWQTSLVLRPRNGLTTRGWNGYSGNEHRAFKYLTEKKRITADDLSPALLQSASFHLICSASRCIELVERINHLRPSELSRPRYIWEPVPDLCTSTELASIRNAFNHVDIISPNHDELGAIFDFKHGHAVDIVAVANHARDLLDFASPQSAVVVRCGKQGSYVADGTKETWLPAYHQDQAKVVDPTGGGNGFLGGLAVGLVRTNDIIEATHWASISASFCIEQVGLPALSNHGPQELWNGSSVIKRLDEYKARIPR
ncbi:hypothetical protein AMS68_006850 [Peltaster fructicola]|uniref:Carbohydrate kinase PfkB domain-containing protein n=1 Tax=Peltaster fructicola TaxID=286661 RepID=A0A6H0Y2T9_9PEZI|nr:hypothetical protein AMS68_006850 [Peltaster fructicola]